MPSGGNGSNGAAASGQDETFWNKFGTLGRKKKVEEVKEVVTEGKHAIDSPGMPKSAEMPPEVVSWDICFAICELKNLKNLCICSWPKKIIIFMYFRNTN